MYCGQNCSFGKKILSGKIFRRGKYLSPSKNFVTFPQRDFRQKLFWNWDEEGQSAYKLKPQSCLLRSFWKKTLSDDEMFGNQWKIIQRFFFLSLQYRGKITICFHLHPINRNIVYCDEMPNSMATKKIKK